ncbi:MAG: membrane protein insertase YidC [Cryomorphaceae bacterium]|nr:membrane protein insertase YidC [Cryomorphaceae bacterium]
MNKKTDINSIIGFFLIGLIMIYFFWQDAPDTTESVKTPAATEEKEMRQGESDDVADVSAEIDSAVAQTQQVDTTAVPVKNFVLENDKVRISVRSKGARPQELWLKEFQTYKRFEQDEPAPLYLAKGGNFRFNLDLGNNLQTSDLHFKAIEESNEKLKLQATTAKGNVFITYHLRPGEYETDLRIQTDFDVTDPSMFWTLQALRHEKNDEYETNKTTIYFHFADNDKSDRLSETRDQIKEKENINWFAFKQQFFSTIVRVDGQFPLATLETSAKEGRSDVTKNMTANVRIRNSGNLDLPLHLYSGPNRFKRLKSYGHGYEKVVPLGWGIFGWINRGVIINIFSWLETYGLNYGIIILLMTLMIKLVLFPLTYGSYRSMAKMRVLKPEIDAINEKYKDKDAMKKQQATMQLYQQAGVNPLGGCIPMLFQMPILFAVFQFFPASIELRHQSFLWANDLSSYDSIYNLPFSIPFYGDHVSLFTLLMTVTTIMYTYMNQQLTGSNSQYPQMKYIMYLMPVVFLGVFNNFAAGLSYYYFVANLITFGQQFAIRGIINEEKILAKIEENKKKPKKRSKFQQRMEEMAKERGQQLPGQKKNNKKKK